VQLIHHHDAAEYLGPAVPRPDDMWANWAFDAAADVPRSGHSRGGQALSAFPIVNRLCGVALLYGRGGRLTALK
jgi:hypothetical protein